LYNRCSRRNTGNEFATSFQIQLNRIRVALDFMLQIYSGKHGKSPRLDGLEKALIATLEKELIVYMEQNMFLVRLYKTIND
jgi:hypothetical protein